MSNTHTPGPWHVGKRFSDGRQMVTPINARDLACESCGRGEGTWLVAWCHENAVPKKQVVANARLLAAAPELLAALRSLLSRDFTYCGGFVTDCNISMDEVHRARDAVAKAEAPDSSPSQARPATRSDRLDRKK